jgi:magnesium-transporting ATPase (P-type)
MVWCITHHMQILAEYTREGLRVIALAKADVPSGSLPASAISSYTQQQLEQAVGLDLVGLAVLENALRPDTTGVIEVLQKAQVGFHSLS